MDPLRASTDFSSLHGSMQLGRATVYDNPIGQTNSDGKGKRRWRPWIRQCRTRLLSCCTRVLQSGVFSILMTVLTLFVLVGDDIRLACFERPQDHYFNWITVVSLCFFMLEILVSSLCREDYFLGFWFLADLFASVSLIFDITIVSEAMMGYPDISAESAFADNKDAGAVEQSEYARASRSSRVGTRVARLLRVVRLIRLSRVIRVLQMMILVASCGRVKPKEDRRFSLGPGEEQKTQAESRVGRKLSERTTQRVIVLVLIMLVAVPQLTPDYGMMEFDSAQYGADVIFQAWQKLEVAVAESSTLDIIGRLRLDWEMQVLNYIYYHNWHAVCPEGTDGECADVSMHRLCWVGHVGYDSGGELDVSGPSVAEDGYIKEIKPSWDPLFNSNTSVSYKFVVGELPEGIQGDIAKPWNTDCSESQSTIRGVSLMPGLPCPRLTLRKQETIWYTPVITNSSLFKALMKQQFVFVFDIRPLIGWEAFLGIVQTVFVVIVLAIGALLFSRDVDQLVLLPIERMISKVETIRQDPLYAIKLGHEKMGAEQQAASSAGSKTSLPLRRTLTAKEKRLKKKKLIEARKATLETKILENAIIKLGSLLALGFGEAGTEIIGANLDDDNATVNAMIPGSKVEAIYGFCGLRNFSTVTEVLQEKTMVFVNQVAEIVHRIVDEHMGHPNKNVGEAFLLVWRISSCTKEMRPKTAGLAILSFVKVVVELARDWQLAEYRTHPALLARLPNFRVSLGYGLHLGWSIEGAIGSEFKIDASYLSPHVNVACRLEAATSEYGVTMLVSEPLVRSCEPQMSRHFRPIDHVKLQGAKKATRLFTVDLHHEILTVEPVATARRRNRMNRAQERQERETRKMSILQDSFQVHDAFNTDKNVRRMREFFFLDFFRAFEKGYLNYEAGEWDVAAKVLGGTRTMLGVEDGPSRTLLEYMRLFDFEAPLGWPGWRDLRDR